MLLRYLVSDSTPFYSIATQKRFGRISKVGTGRHNANPNAYRQNRNEPGYRHNIAGVRFDRINDMLSSDLEQGFSGQRFQNKPDVDIALLNSQSVVKFIGRKNDILGGYMFHKRRIAPNILKNTTDVLQLPSFGQFDVNLPKNHFYSKICLTLNSSAKLSTDLLVHDAYCTDLTLPHNSGSQPNSFIYSYGGSLLIEKIADAGGNACQPGSVLLTEATGRLPCLYVAHTVIPKFKQEDPEYSFALLKHAYSASLEHAVSGNVEATSIVFPPLATGVQGFPQTQACEVACTAVAEWLSDNWERASRLERIVFATLLTDDWKMYDQWIRDRMDFTPDTYKKMLDDKILLDERTVRKIQEDKKAEEDEKSILGRVFGS